MLRWVLNKLPCCDLQEALVEAAVGEEKRRILEQREEMEKSADEIREGFRQRGALLEVRCSARMGSGKNGCSLVVELRI